MGLVGGRSRAKLGLGSNHEILFKGVIALGSPTFCLGCLRVLRFCYLWFVACSSGHSMAMQVCNDEEGNTADHVGGRGAGLQGEGAFRSFGLWPFETNPGAVSPGFRVRHTLPNGQQFPH